jgi:plasmid replication initiation protein
MGKQKRLEIGAESREVVAKANELIRARHRFTTYEQRIFASMVARLERGETTFSLQKIPIRQICQESNESDLYRRIDEITDRLVNQTVVIRRRTEEGKREFEKINVLSKCTYREGKGIVEARFTEDMRPFLLKLKGRFTLYLIKVFLKLRSKYSTQIYELLKMRQGLGSRYKISVEEFRRTLGLEDKYEGRFYSIKDRVIEQARRELKEKADIYFTYRVIRDGQTPTAIEFLIHENEEVIRELQEDTSLTDDSSESTTQSKSPVVGWDGSKERRAEVDRGSESSPQKQSSPKIDAKRMFLEDLSQEELDGLSEGSLQDIYEKARARAEESNPDAVSSIVAYETYNRMKDLWESR